MNADHYMFKELSEVPELTRQILKPFEYTKISSGSDLKVDKIEHIKLIASGSSHNVALLGCYIIEELTGIPVSVEYASEYAHRDFTSSSKTAYIAVSQSGKTADVLACIEKIRTKPHYCVIGITNVKNSPLHNIADTTLFIQAGEEKAVPATKTFSLQILTLLLFAMGIAGKKKRLAHKLMALKAELTCIADKLEEVIKQADQIKKLAEIVSKYKHIVILSRGITYPIAIEGALKLKETCYIDANGYAAGEFMHGYMAMLDKNYAVIVLENINDNLLTSNIERLKKKTNAFICGITVNKSTMINYDHCIQLPSVENKLLSGFLFATCLQMLSYFCSTALGFDPDKPRGLTKFLEKE